MAKRAPGMKSTAPIEWEQFVALDEDDPRELIDGELVEVEVPSKIHEWIVTCLVSLLWTWARAHGGLALASGYKVRITARRAVMPDVQFFRKGRESVGGDDGLTEGAPDLVVEVVSKASRRHDRVRKLEWYREIRVPEYWIVDPEDRTLERLVLERGSYRMAAALAEEAVFRPDSFPGLAIELAQLWTLPGAGRSKSPR